VNPGWIHELVAAIGLKGAEAIAKRHGIEIDVGEVKTVKEYTQAASENGDEGPQPIDVASRVVAHLFHRIPGIKKIGKRAEGKEKKAGIVSDSLALVAQLMARNEALVVEKGAETAEAIGGDLLNNLVKGLQPRPASGVINDTDIPDFGRAEPEVVPINNETEVQ
jgi:hypothetical protein